MTDNEVGAALRRLPRATTSPRFAADVARTLRVEPRARAPWRLAAAYAMVFVLLVGTYAASMHRERRQKLDEIRAEGQRIESDLQRVKAAADDAQPVVVLENGDTRVIVDLKQRQQSIYY